MDANIREKQGDQLLKILLESGAVLVDVRTHPEFAGFHIPNACNICPEEIEIHLEKIKCWNKPVIVYSTYGRRSKIAFDILKREGIEVYNAGSQDRILSLMDSIKNA